MNKFLDWTEDNGPFLLAGTVGFALLTLGLVFGGRQTPAPKSAQQQWERIETDGPDVMRLKIRGGWLVRCGSLEFVPDARHEWLAPEQEETFQWLIPDQELEWTLQDQLNFDPAPGAWSPRVRSPRVEQEQPKIRRHWF